MPAKRFCERQGFAFDLELQAKDDAVELEQPRLDRVLGTAPRRGCIECAVP